jgi:hypothetical protein
MMGTTYDKTVRRSQAAQALQFLWVYHTSVASFPPPVNILHVVWSVIAINLNRILRDKYKKNFYMPWRLFQRPRFTSQTFLQKKKNALGQLRINYIRTHLKKDYWKSLKVVIGE